MINALREQKRLEDAWAPENKEPDYIAITLDTSSAAKAFERVKTIPTHVWDAMGVLIVYVVRHPLIPKSKDKKDPPFGEEDTNYTSIDQEVIAHTPILTNDADYSQDYKALETNEPFAPVILTDLKKVWTILH